ncbi:coiled-coil domain-containing protein 141 isoform X2 [Thunnus thynnus]|uniref:coiled-coil domain-containing protein 141 isoform X2 n=1 Tax=Thunnus thynnus TaxID=8237 RepID=UPI0035271429
MKPSRSFTTLSTIAIQAGQSQIVVSVLKSGSLVHLQLVQVHPGLCEIGSNKEENQTMIQEQQQLMEKLKKHEREVLAVVEKNRNKWDEGVMERRSRKQEEEQEVYKAMVVSLNEGWLLLLRLLERRQEVLTLASDFYCRAQEFAVSVDRVEDLQVRPDNDRLTEVQLTYDSMRRDLLGKSLQVLTSSSVLLQKLRQLQRIEAVQRRGEVLQDEDEEESSQSSQCSRGVALRLEELMETLQDRRRRADLAVRLQLQQAENSIMSRKREQEARHTSSEDWSLTVDEMLEVVSASDPKPESRSEDTGHTDSRSKETRGIQSGSRPDLKLTSTSDESGNLQLGSRSEAEELNLSELSRKQEETKQQRATTTSTSGQVAGQQRMLGNEEEQKETQSEDCAHHDLTNQRQQLLLSCEHLVDKVLSWVQQSSSVLSNSYEAGRQLHEAEDTLNTHLLLHTQAKAAGRNAENMKQIVDQIRTLHTDVTSKTSSQPPSETSRQPSLLKTLTEQLKRGSTGKWTRTSTTQPNLPANDPTGCLSPELAGRVDLVLEELQTLNQKIDSNLQLLKPYVTFLRTAQQVEEEMAELREIYSRGSEKEEEEEWEAGNSNIRTTTSSRSSVKKKQTSAHWQEMTQSVLTAQELGNNYIHTVSTVSGAALNLQCMVSVVQQTVERLSQTKQEVNDLRSYQQIKIQQQQDDMKNCRKYQERLLKTRQDLNCVSELLDSCTLMDLGSELQTSRLLERFSQAKPHFIQLDAEAEFMVKHWETLKRVQHRLELKEEDVSELLKLHQRVKEKIQQSESILSLASNFHLTAKQLEALLQSDPAGLLKSSTGLCGASEVKLREDQQQIQNLFNTVSTLKTDICTAITNSGSPCFRVEQLEARLLCLDSLCVSWLNEAAQCEEKLRRELLTRLFNNDFNQLRDSFKELKKRFSNLKFNYLKRNDRTRNAKAVRNQLQQVEAYEEKLQALRKRLQGVTARLGSEIKDGGVVREAEDAINELQRQMREFEQSVGEHRKTLDMTCRLQQAMEEYQFWCEDASATIARVGKFSSECRSTEAISVLHRQFEKFVWPTVPQQEERISQITELAVRLHGVEEGRRYIEKTVRKHSEMVESIRELSDGLLELEAKLKLENLKQQQNVEEKEIKEETQRRSENETEEKDEEKEKELKEDRKMKKKEQKDNRSTQEAADMYELKETGHTPELTTEHDGKEVPVKRQTATNRKPPLQKSRSQEADKQTDTQTVISESSQRQGFTSSSAEERHTSSYCSTHTFSLCRSPVGASRRVHAVQSQLQLSTTDPQVTPPSVNGPLFADIQQEFQRKETQETGQQTTSLSRESNTTPLQDVSEVELQHEEVMTEDSLSNDEYECASPDDISLPPLAETPESIAVQSDVEESFCFSSHSIHINQHSHQYHTMPEHSVTGNVTGAVRQQRESSETERCPTPPTCLHSSARFRTESSSFGQSPLTVPAPSLLTSTLCTILRTGETSTANFPQSAHLSVGCPELSFFSGFNPLHKSNMPDNKDNNVLERRSPSQTEHFLKEHSRQNGQPQSSSSKGKITKNAASKSETLPRTDLIPQAAELNQTPSVPQSSYHPQPFNGEDPDLHKDRTPPKDMGFLKFSTSTTQTTTANCQDNSFSQSFAGSKSGLHHNINTQKTICSQSSDSHRTLEQTSNSVISPQESPLSQVETMPQINPPLQTGGFAQSPSNTVPGDTGLIKSCTTCPQTSTVIHTDSPQSYPESRSGLDQNVNSLQTSKEAPSVSVPQSSCLTKTTTVTQQIVYCQSSASDSHCNVPQASSDLRSQQERPVSQGSGGLPGVLHAPIPPEPNSVSNISSNTITGSKIFNSKQSHQTVYSLHESLASTCTQQFVHDPGMNPSSPAQLAAPPQPEAQTKALAQQANLHVTPPSSSSHLLTPDQDPDICQPMAIREEIRLTPQIQGPPLPAPSPLPQAQTEALPQGKASKSGPPCFTRPLSRATVMEGSPVTLEVEVTGHPEPMLTWFKEGEVSATGPGRALACEDGKQFLFIPEALDGGLYKAQYPSYHDCSDGSKTDDDRWLVAEVFDIINVDWQTWFGTLCVLLWLLYLIIL